MFLNRRQIELIKKAIEDYNFIKEEIEYKISKGYTIEEISKFLERFKDIEITSIDTINGEEWLDFLYKDITTCVCNTQEKGMHMGTTFEIYDRESHEYIVEDFIDIAGYEKLINTPKDKMLSDIVADLKYYDSHNQIDSYNACVDKIISFLKEEF